MAITLNDNQDIRAPKHADDRLDKIYTLTELYAINVNYRYPGMITWVEEERSYYFLDAVVADDLSDNDLWQPLDQIVTNNEYVQQIVYVETAANGGDDATGVVNDATLPFETMKAAIGALTASKCAMRIGPGNHTVADDAADGDILQDISDFVTELIIESNADLITCENRFVTAQGTSLISFSFFGEDTDITSGSTAFNIEGSAIYECRIVCNDIEAAASPFQVIHPGTNDIFVNNLTSTGVGAGYCLSVRGNCDTRMVVKGDCTYTGTQNSNAAIVRARFVYGKLDVLINGKCIDSAAAGQGFSISESSGAMRFVVKKGIEYDTTRASNIISMPSIAQNSLIELDSDITALPGSGNLRLISMSSNGAANKQFVKHKGNVYVESGELFYLNGSSIKSVELNGKYQFLANGFGSNGICRITSSAVDINVNLKGEYILPDTVAMFDMPDTYVGSANIVTDNIQIRFDTSAGDLFNDATVTSGTWEIVCLGTFRTNSTVAFPSYASLSYLTDLTVPTGSSGIALTDLSVGAEGVPSGDGQLDYNNLTGVFTYTPPLLTGFLSSGDNISELVNDEGYITLADIPQDYIPLSGTEVGSPVTGDIELSETTITDDSIFIFTGDIRDSETEYRALKFTDDFLLQLELERNNSTTSLDLGEGTIGLKMLSSSGAMSLGLSSGSVIGITLNDSVSNIGLTGASYYGANYTDNTYVQKKYVDDSLGSYIPLAGTDVGIPVTGDIEFDGGTGIREISNSGRIIFEDDHIDFYVGQFFQFGTDNGVGSIYIVSGPASSGVRGIHSDVYYGDFSTDNDFIQKKYVDDEIAAISFPADQDLQSVLDEGAIASITYPFSIELDNTTEPGDTIDLAASAFSVESRIQLNSGQISLRNELTTVSDYSELYINSNYIEMIGSEGGLNTKRFRVSSDSGIDYFQYTLNSVNLRMYIDDLTVNRDLRWGDFNHDFRSPNSGDVFTYNGTSAGWAAPIGGGGQVDSVVGTLDQIDVDASDPVNPVVSLATAITDDIADGVTAFSWGDHAGLYLPIATQLAQTKTLVAGEFFTSYDATTGLFTSAVPPNDNDNFYLTALGFDTATGILTGTVTGASNPTVDLDGRWSLLGHTHIASEITDFDTEVANNSAVVLNTAKVSNATHTGDVTGATVLTIAAGAVDIPMLSATGTPSASTYLRGDNTWATVSGGSAVGGYSMIWAEENGNANPGTNSGYQYSFGNGATNDEGVVIGFDCTVSALTISTGSSTSITVELVVNNTPTGETVSTSSSQTAVALVDVAIVAGDKITFRTTAGTGGQPVTVGAALRSGAVPDALVNDTSPQLGGDLDLNGFTITGLDHVDLANIGTNTHAQIDTHIADSTIHFTQAAISIPSSQITDFDTEVSNNTDVSANTAARHAAVTVLDSSEIDFTLTGQQITASIITGSIDVLKLDAGVQASLGLADSALQSFTETDPVYTASTVSSIIDGTGFLKNDGAGNWTYDNNTYLTSYTETQDLSDVLTLGNNSGGNNIVIDNADIISFSAIAGEIMSFSGGHRLLHASGNINWDIDSLGVGDGTTNISGLTSAGKIYGTSLEINDTSTSFNVTHSEPVLTANRVFTYPDGDIDWTGGSEGQVMTLQADGSWSAESIPTGTGTAIPKIGFAAKNSNTTIPATTFQPVTFLTEIEDTNSSWNGSVFTVPTGEGGLYEIIGHATFSAVNDTNIAIVGVTVNGSLPNGGLLGRGTSGGTGLSGFGGGIRLNLSAGDEVRMVAYCQNATTLYNTGGQLGYSSFSAYKVVGGGASQLSDLSDVNTSTPTNKNVLVADGTDWESRPLEIADVSDFSDNSTNWDTAFGWGDHALAGYLTSFTETDPVFLASPAGGILLGDITNWDNAHSWGDHALAGYITGYTVTEADVLAHQAALTITESQISDLTHYDSSDFFIDFSASTFQTLSDIPAYPTGSTRQYFLIWDDNGPDSFSWEEIQTFFGANEINDLTAAVTWANIPDAFVPASAVTQHEGALLITKSQITDFTLLKGTKTSDQDITSNTTFVDDAEVRVSITPPASGVDYYSFECLLVVQNAASIALKFQFNTTNLTGSAAEIAALHSLGNSSVGLGTDIVASFSGTRIFRFYGTFAVPDSATAGDLFLRWAQNVSNANITRMRQSSYLRIEKH